MVEEDSDIAFRNQAEQIKGVPLALRAQLWYVPRAIRSNWATASPEEGGWRRRGHEAVGAMLGAENGVAKAITTTPTSKRAEDRDINAQCFMEK